VRVLEGALPLARIDLILRFPAGRPVAISRVAALAQAILAQASAFLLKILSVGPSITINQSKAESKRGESGEKWGKVEGSEGGMNIYGG
jgi:hypothetical protein